MEELRYSIAFGLFGLIVMTGIIGIFIVNELIAINKTLKEIKEKGEKKDNG